MSIPAESAILSAIVRIPPDARGLIILASAGTNDSYATRSDRLAPRLEDRGYATLTVNLLTRDEEREDRSSGFYHLDIPLLSSRLCQVTGAIRSHPRFRSCPLGVFVEGMAAPAAAVAASRQNEIRAIVSWNGRADLADNVLRTVTAPTLFLTTRLDPHVIDLNRKAAGLIRAVNRLDVVDGCDRGIDRDRAVVDRAADWFDAFVQIGAHAHSHRDASTSRVNGFSMEGP